TVQAGAASTWGNLSASFFAAGASTLVVRRAVTFLPKRSRGSRTARKTPAPGGRCDSAPPRGAGFKGGLGTAPPHRPAPRTRQARRLACSPALARGAPLAGLLGASPSQRPLSGLPAPRRGVRALASGRLLEVDTRPRPAARSPPQAAGR